jgi:hypothetical protein
VEAAIDFHRRLGGQALLARNAALAADAVSLLCRLLNTEPGAEDAVAASMGVVRVPLTGPATPERAAELRERLLDRRADAPLHARKSAAPRAYQRQTKQGDPLIACAYLAGTNTRRVVALAPEPDSPAEERDAGPGSRACLDLREREEFPDLEEEPFLIISYVFHRAS